MGETRHDDRVHPVGRDGQSGEGHRRLGFFRRLLVGWLRSRRHHATIGRDNGFLSPEHSIAVVLALHRSSLPVAMGMLFRRNEPSGREGEERKTLMRRSGDEARLRRA